VQDSPFDEYANRYDASFTRTPLGRTLRGMVWSRLDEVFAPGERILELGCGTGEDALYLAQRGLLVVATDAAAEMVAVAKQKAQANRVQAEFAVLPMDDVPQALNGRCFDGVFSNFGAVNCSRDLSALAAGLASVLRPKASLLWVVMGKHVPWEWGWYLARGKIRKAFRRLDPNGVEWRGLKVRYPTPNDLARMLQPHFRLRHVSPLGCVLPPTYAAAWLNRSPRALKLLSKAETSLHSLSFLASCADHYMIEAIRY
jgi:ubiquinone/menaquinone biosynthesis C-methylase UbiE